MASNNDITTDKTGNADMTAESDAPGQEEMTDAEAQSPSTEEQTLDPTVDDTIEAGLVDDTIEAGIEDAEDTTEDATDTDETATQPTAQETITQLEAALTEAESRADGYLDKLQRTAAEFQNSKRRQEKQLADAIDWAGSHMIRQLLPILDDLDLAFQNVPDGLDEETDAWLGGFEQIQKKLISLLDEQGVTVIDDGGLFDPNRHEAVSSEPNEDVESGHLIAIVRTGYELKGRVLRPALVRVAM